ncbi:glycosyltransferase family 2 protein [Janibacter sp. GXQ6167]|uniref:glycosyltransferase family 2 protein n=1 Tax=Janibacter sp. GXQ6167 TaxID=3240791 RepID=UPI0035266816
MDSPEALAASVVIPVRNGGDLLRVQLDALASQQGAPPFEVVVSDNGSTDSTREIAESYRDRLDLRIVDSGDQPGVSHARNVGAGAVHSPLALFCDADDKVSAGWVAAMVAGLDEFDIVGGPLEFAELSEPDAAHLRYEPPANELPITMKFRPYANGGNLGIRASVMRRLGGFDTSFRGGHEEVDLAWRAQALGYTVGFAPDAIGHIRHRGSLRATMRQTFHYGRTYAQLFSRHRDQPIPRTPWRREVRTYGILLRQGVGAVRQRDLSGWLTTMSWTAGRLWGDVQYRVRAPL